MKRALYTYEHTCRFLVSQTLYEQYTLCFLSGTKQEKDKMKAKKCSSCTSCFGLQVLFIAHDNIYQWEDCQGCKLWY